MVENIEGCLQKEEGIGACARQNREGVYAEVFTL